jgi:Trehalose-phosphatase
MTAADDGGALPAELAADLAARAAQIALCLDFDGTLSPIVPDPEWARPLRRGRAARPLAARFAALALVSGRPAGYLATQAAAPGVRYLDLYELEEIRDGQVWVDPRLEAGRPPVAAAHQDLRVLWPGRGRRAASTGVGARGSAQVLIPSLLRLRGLPGARNSPAHLALEQGVS